MDFDRWLARAVVEQGLFGKVIVIGRYVLRGELGVGGMGTVYLARDPQLGRSVAIKVVRAAQTEEAKDRLVREAQALAALSHPNVVAIYEVGTQDGTPFIAMEYVPGRTLGEWLGELRPTPAQVIDMYSVVGRGLAAAHATGLVHRDFKPSNVMVGEDGRPRILDFGIARIHGTPSDDRTSGGPSLSPTELVRTTQDHAGSSTRPGLTGTGVVMGTPLYMAPEQRAGRPADPRSDQYSFCLALYEALYGEHPFGASSYEELVTRAWAGHVSDPPAGTNVAAAVRKVVLRGLEVDPSARYPDMDACLRALERAARPRGGSALAVGLGGIVLLGALGLWRLSPPDLCAGVGASSTARWDEASRAAVEQQFVATGVPHAAATWAIVDRELDAHARDLAAARVGACEAQHPSVAVVTTQRRCLEHHEQQLAGLVERLAAADEAAVEKAPMAITETLDDPARCLDLDYLAQRVDPPEDDVAQEVAAVRTDLIAVEQLLALGSYREGRERGDRALEAARATGHAPVVVEALFAAGKAAHRNGETKAALDMLEEVYFLASRIPHEEIVAQTSVQLVGVATAHRDAARAREWSRHAEADLERTHATDGLRVDWLNNHGLALQLEGAHEDALTFLRRSLELVDAGESVDLERKATALNNISSSLHELGRSDQAVQHLEAALAATQALVPPEHPKVAGLHNNLGVALGRLGRYDDAKRHHERALAIREVVLGPDHRHTVLSRANLGTTLSSLGQYDAALLHLERALHSAERSDDDPLSAATCRQQIGMVLNDAGRSEEAIVVLERALDESRAVLGPTHPALVVVSNNLALAHGRAGHHAEAITALQSTIELATAALGPSHPSVATLHENLGAMLFHSGRYDESLAAHRHALAVREAAPSCPVSSLATSHHNLGTTLSNLERKPEAIDELRQAVSLWRRATTEHKHLVRLAASLTALGVNLSSTGDDHEATAVLEEAQRVLESTETLEASSLATTLTAQGEHHLRRGRPEAAIDGLERALGLSRPSAEDVGHVAKTRFALARALGLTQGRDHERAETLARQARDAWAELGPHWATDLAEADRWLRQRDR